MGFNSAFKGLKLLKKTGNGSLNNLNDPVLNVLKRKTDFHTRHVTSPRNFRYARSTFLQYLLPTTYQVWIEMLPALHRWVFIGLHHRFNPKIQPT